MRENAFVSNYGRVGAAGARQRASTDTMLGDDEHESFFGFRVYNVLNARERVNKLSDDGSSFDGFREALPNK